MYRKTKSSTKLKRRAYLPIRNQTNQGSPREDAPPRRLWSHSTVVFHLYGYRMVNSRLPRLRNPGFKIRDRNLYWKFETKFDRSENQTSRPVKYASQNRSETHVFEEPFICRNLLVQTEKLRSIDTSSNTVINTILGSPNYKWIIHWSLPGWKNIFYQPIFYKMAKRQIDRQPKLTKMPKYS